MTCFGGMSPGLPPPSSAPGPQTSRAPRPAVSTLENPIGLAQRAGRGLGRAGFDGLEGGNGFLARPDRPHTHRPQAPLSVQAPTMGPPSRILACNVGYIVVTRVYEDFRWK